MTQHMRLISRKGVYYIVDDNDEIDDHFFARSLELYSNKDIKELICLAKIWYGEKQFGLTYDINDCYRKIIDHVEKNLYETSISRK